MKPRFLILTTFCLITAARADLVIEQEVETAGQPKQSMIMSFKDGKIRADIGKGMSTITDTATGDTSAMMHEQKMIVVTSGAAAKAAIEAAQKGLAGTEKPKKLDKVEAIGDRPCEVWAYEINGSKITMWVDKNYPGYASFKDEMNKLATALLKDGAASFDPGGMIVKTEAVMAGITSTSLVKSVKQTKVDASIFNKPEGYTEMNLSK